MNIKNGIIKIKIDEDNATLSDMENWELLDNFCNDMDVCIPFGLIKVEGDEYVYDFATDYTADEITDDEYIEAADFLSGELDKLTILFKKGEFDKWVSDKK